MMEEFIPVTPDIHDESRRNIYRQPVDVPKPAAAEPVAIEPAQPINWAVVSIVVLVVIIIIILLYLVMWKTSAQVVADKQYYYMRPPATQPAQPAQAQTVQAPASQSAQPAQAPAPTESQLDNVLNQLSAASPTVETDDDSVDEDLEFHVDERDPFNGE